ncbi:MFS transporter [Chelatococcus reniformis]|uniref:MFS transporter n=1 Tax=Chelatococcus reniformis TaxID=1494448 RepID=A0A916U7T3_9HYPH|nr:MFS transporter [Chelatococcus reniformis]GGC61195.1 MFS transporter [Chelatococcus reniformis]
MSNAATGDFDAAPVTPRFWASIVIFMLTGVVDFFDFFVVAFLVAVLAPQWHLTFGQTSIMLLSAGVGAMVGAVAWGALADRFGRKLLSILGVVICAVGSGSIAFIPDNAWVLFCVLRFFVGFGLAAAATAGVPLMVEMTPTRYRTLLTSLAAVPVTLGILSASILSALLLPTLGWRGLAALGFLPIVLALLTLVVVPESARWLLSRGRTSAARRAIGRLHRVDADTVVLPPPPATAPAARFRDLLAEPRRFWLVTLTFLGASAANYGVFLWGPTIVALLLGVGATDAAHVFVYVGLAGMVARAGFALLAQRIGRRPCGQIMGYGTAIALALAAIFHDAFIGGVPVFLICLVVGAIFFDGGFANLAPYPAEIYPVRLSARAVGLSQFANGIGKILGPLCLALIAGADNYVVPKATADAVLPAFLFLAACGLMVGLAYSLLGIESHGKPVALFNTEPEAPAAQPAPALPAHP